MTDKNTVPKPVDDPDTQAVERQYGTLAPVYAATRAAAAEAAGRKDAAREWSEVEIETERDGEADLER
jgi:hypothetical protein